jgi:hypothetical protein
MVIRVLPTQSQSLAERVAALEKRAGIRPTEAVAKPAPPPMGNVHAMARTTQLMSTSEQRAIANRRAAARAAMARHSQAGRFFQAPREPANARVPRASRTGSVV